MRLTYVIPFYAPAWGFGGPPRVAHDMARHLVARGHRVDVLTTDADAESRLRLREETLDGVHVHRSPNLNNRCAVQFNAFLPVGFGGSFKTHAARSDLVHLFDFRTLQNAIALQQLDRAARRPKLVLSAFGELPRATGLKRSIKALYDAAFGFRLLRRAARVLAQTPEEADEYRRFGCDEHQIRQLPLAVSLDDLPAASQPGAFRTRLGLSEPVRLVLFLGRIHQYKGLDLLIRSFAEAARQRPDLRLVVAGRDDGYLSSARQLAASLLPAGAVLFPGPIYGADRFAAYRDADLFAITPTHAEQTSLAALEACAVGTPVLVTGQAPIPGLDAAGAGMTVPADVPRISAALATLLDCPNRAEMGRLAQAMVAERYSWSTITTVLESIYAEVVDA